MLAQATLHILVRQIGDVDLIDIRRHDAEELLVAQEMVHQRHHPGRDRTGGITGDRAWPISVAGKVCQRGHFERGLEDVGEFVEQVRCRGGIGSAGEVGYKADQARALVDHFAERGPRIGNAVAGGRDVAECVDAGGLVGRCQVGCGSVVGVDENERDNFIRVVAQPGVDLAEPVGEQAGVEQRAGCVTETEVCSASAALGLLDVHLSGENSDAGVELDDGIVEVVARRREGGALISDKGAVVSSQVGDVVVRLVTQRSCVVARSSCVLGSCCV